MNSQLDDKIVELAKQTLHDTPGNFKQLKANQVRKFWDILKMQKNSKIALKLVQHQYTKAEKEVIKSKEDLYKMKRKNSINSFKLRKKEDDLTAKKTKRGFWYSLIAVADEEKFKNLMLKDFKNTIDVCLPLQILFAEALYSEFLYLTRK